MNVKTGLIAAVALTAVHVALAADLDGDWGFTYVNDDGKPIVEDDLRVSEFVQETNSVNMSFNMAVTISGVTPGATAKPAHLTEIFGVKGDEELNLSQFDEEDLATTFSSPAQGMLNLNTTVNKDADRYFMKMKVR